nr:DUF2975 domain-containing protein [uncultured Flavobacterium sp.]
MKRNITIITTALLLVLIPLSIYIALCFIAGLGGLTNEVSRFSKYLITEFFTPKREVDGISLSLFLIAYSALIACLFVYVNSLRLTLKDIAKKGAFEDNNANKLRASGRGLVRFAWSKYLLFSLFGPIAVWDIGVLFYQLLPFLALYTIGKFILVIADMTQRGEMLLEETELTI